MVSDATMQKALLKSGMIVESEAKDKCPVDTGILRSSITTTLMGNSVSVGTIMDYAPYVEYGTGLFAVNGDGRKTKWSYTTADGQWHTTNGQESQPFLEPALLKNKQEIIRTFKETIEEEEKNV